MLARIRQYGDLREARAEWQRLGLPDILDDERKLFTKVFAFVEDADHGLLSSLTADVDDLGGKTFRCDASITRMLIAGPRQMLFEIGEDDSPASRALGRAITNFLNEAPGHLKLGGRDLVMNRTLVMGVLNVTPGSFSDGGRYDGIEKAVARALEMVDQGADIIDVGGESTRPFSDPVSELQEGERVLPVLRRLVDSIGVPISVDTRRPAVARRALEEGAAMINDVYGLRDPEMAQVVADGGVPVVVMHMRGEPKTMQKDIHYDDVVGDIMLFLDRNARLAVEAGVDPGNIIIDPGIGFGKTMENNLEIIRRLREFRCMGLPILIGPSRKAFIGRILDLPVEDRLEGTLSAMTASIINGADIVRVHDVKEARRATSVADAIKKA